VLPLKNTLTILVIGFLLVVTGGRVESSSQHFHLRRTLASYPDSTFAVFNPAADLDESGNPWITWDYELFGSKKIFLARSADRGFTFETPRLITYAGMFPDSAGIAMFHKGTLETCNPDIAISEDNAWIVYERLIICGIIGREAIVLRRSSDGGDTFSSPVMVADESGTEYRNPSIRYINGDIIISWESRQQARGLWQVFVTRSEDGGETFLDPVQASNAKYSVEMSDLGYDPLRENVLICFRSSRNGYPPFRKAVFANRANRVRLKFESVDLEVTRDYPEAGRPSLTSDSEGKTICIAAPVYEIQDSCVTVRVFHSNDGGLTFDKEGLDFSRTPKHEISSSPSIVLVGGETGCIWLDERESRDGRAKLVYRTTFRNSENLLLNPRRLSNNYDWPGGTPTLVYDEKHDAAHVVYADTSLGRLYYIRSVKQKVLLWDNDQNRQYYDPDGSGFLTEPALELEKLLGNAGIPRDSIVVSQTLFRDLDPSEFPALFVSLGWREGSQAAGMVNPAEMDILREYLDNFGKVFVEGNDFALSCLSAYPDFPEYFGISAVEDGDSTNVETMMIVPFETMYFPFDHGNGPDLFMDEISAVDPSTQNVLIAMSPEEPPFVARGVQNVDLESLNRETIVCTFPLGGLENHLDTTRTAAMIEMVRSLNRTDFKRVKGVVEEIEMALDPEMFQSGELYLEFGDTLRVDLFLKGKPGNRGITTPVFIYVVQPGQLSQAVFLDERSVTVEGEEYIHRTFTYILDSPVFSEPGSYEMIIAGRMLGESFLRPAEVLNLEFHIVSSRYQNRLKIRRDGE